MERANDTMLSSSSGAYLRNVMNAVLAALNQKNNSVFADDIFSTGSSSDQVLVG